MRTPEECFSIGTNRGSVRETPAEYDVPDWGNMTSAHRTAETRLRVRYKETDQMGISHHANYFVWFEIGRTELCKQLGSSYREIEDGGLLLVVIEIACRYLVPFRYDDEVLLRTTVVETGRRALRFEYELWDGAATQMHASGASTHFWVDRTTRRPIAVPDAMWKQFE